MTNRTSPAAVNVNGNFRTLLLGAIGFGIGFAILAIAIRVARTEFELAPGTPYRILLASLYGLAGGLGGAALCISLESKRRMPLWAFVGFIASLGGVVITNFVFRLAAGILVPFWNFVREAFGPWVLISVSSTLNHFFIGIFAGLIVSGIFGDRERGQKFLLGSILGFAAYGLWLSIAGFLFPRAISALPYLRSVLDGLIGGGIIGLFMAWSMLDSGDGELLSASPIAKKLMYLLWLDDRTVASIRSALVGNESVNVFMGDSSEQRDWEITWADMTGLGKIMPIANKAFTAGQKGNFNQSIYYYKQALRLAPACDLYLMSIGSAYTMIGQKDRAVLYLRRAAEISPGNARIQENLAKAVSGAGEIGIPQHQQGQIQLQAVARPAATPKPTPAPTMTKTRRSVSGITKPVIEEKLRAYLGELQAAHRHDPGENEWRQICNQLLGEEQFGFVVKSISENLPKALSDGESYEATELFAKFAESSYFVAVTILPWLTPDEIHAHLSNGYSGILKELAAQIAVIDYRSPTEAALNILPWTHLVHWIFCSDGENAKVHLSLMPEAANPEAERVVQLLAEELFNPTERKQLGLQPA